MLSALNVVHSCRRFKSNINNKVTMTDSQLLDKALDFIFWSPALTI